MRFIFALFFSSSIIVILCIIHSHATNPAMRHMHIHIICCAFEKANIHIYYMLINKYNFRSPMTINHESVWAMRTHHFMCTAQKYFQSPAINAIKNYYE